MATLNYWDGYAWKPIAGGGSGGGVPGPAGADGKSVNVYGPQVTQPVPERKGDMWLVDTVVTRSAPQVAGLVAPSVPPAPGLAAPTVGPEAVVLSDPPSVTYATLKE
jgi:hypothetical protein